MGDPLYVIGHKNPDTDSICSAIGLAELKTTIGQKNVIAARAGDINPQTSFILDYLKVAPPKYMPNVYPRAKDIMSVDVVHVSEGTPLLDVMEIMREQHVRFIPVLDGARRPVGALTLMDLAMRYIAIDGERSREVETTLPNIKETLKAMVVTDFLGSAEKSFSVFIGAMAVDSFLDILGDMDPSKCAVIAGDREDIQMTSIEKGVGLLVVTGGFPVKERMVELAKSKGVSIVVSPHDTATTALLVRLSTPACRICAEKFEKASPEDLVDDIKYRLADVNGLVVLDGDGVMLGVITKSNLLRPPATRLVLVDHNELSQAVDGADKVEVVEVIDHHRVGNFQTAHPIPFICDPVGSTSTLVSEQYRHKDVPIKKEIAGLLLGGVLSDTVILKSPTTTPRDVEAVKWLEQRSGLDHVAFGKEIFAATSSLKKRGAGAAVNSDYKVFEAKGKKFGIGQVETIGFDEFYEEKEKLTAELVKAKENKDLQLSALLVTDIVYGNSLFLMVAEREIVYNLDYPKVEDGVYELKNVISRKKQVVPHVLGIFNSVY